MDKKNFISLYHRLFIYFLFLIQYFPFLKFSKVGECFYDSPKNMILSARNPTINFEEQTKDIINYSH